MFSLDCLPISSSSCLTSSVRSAVMTGFVCVVRLSDASACWSFVLLRMSFPFLLVNFTRNELSFCEM